MGIGKWAAAGLVRRSIAAAVRGVGEVAVQSERRCPRCGAVHRAMEPLEARRLLSSVLEFGLSEAPCTCANCLGMQSPLVQEIRRRHESDFAAGRMAGQGGVGVAGALEGVSTQRLPSQAPTVVDVFMYYGSLSIGTAGSEDSAVLMIGDFIRRTNQAFADSDIPVVVRLVGTERSGYDGNGDVLDDLGAMLDRSDGNLDDIDAKRDQFGADLVGFYTEYVSGPAVGVAASIPDPRFSPAANSEIGFFVTTASFSNWSAFTGTHEIGHTLGAGHDIEQNGVGSFSYSHGANITGLSGNPFRTIMATNANPGLRVPLFSSPDLRFQGVAVGDSEIRDNARTIRQISSTQVARYRETVVPEAAPTASVFEREISGNVLTVRVNYLDDVSLNESTIDAGDIEVRDVSGNLLTVGGVELQTTVNGYRAVASYTVDLTGSSGDPGEFDVTLKAGEVLDLSGLAVAAGSLVGEPLDWAGETLVTARDMAGDGTLVLDGRIGDSDADALDIYRVVVSEAGAFEFNLGGLQADLDLQLLTEFGPPALRSADVISVSVNFGVLDEQIALQLTPGVYYLVVSGEDGSYRLTSTLVSAGEVDPVAVLSGASTVNEGALLQLSSAGSGAGGGSFLFALEWDLNYDGVNFTVDSTAADPIFSAANLDGPTVRTVALRVTNEFSRQVVVEQTITVLNVAPTVEVTVSGAAELSPSLAYRVTASDIPLDTAAGFTYAIDVDLDGTYDFDGIGATGTISGPLIQSLLNEGPSTRQIRVRAVDNDGGEGVLLVTFTVANTPPVAQAQFPAALLEGVDATVSMVGQVDSVNDLAAGLIYSYDFDGDGTFEVVNSALATATIPGSLLEGPSTGRLVVRVRDVDGGESLIESTYQVSNQAPLVSITAPNQIDLLVPAQFVSVATDASAADTAAGLSYLWLVRRRGEIILSAPTPNLTFSTATPGDYQFSLTVTDRDGGSTTVVQTVNADQLVKPTLSVTPVGSVREGGFAEFLLSLSAVSVSTVVVDFAYSVAGGAGLEGGVGSRRVTLAVGQLSTLIRVQTLDDIARSSDAAVSLTLQSVTGAQLSATPVGTAPLLDDDVLVSESPARNNRSITISGSEFADEVRIEPGTRGRLRVIANGVLAGEYLAPRRITLDLLGGDDRLTVDRRVRVPLAVYGGSGNDSLVGGSGRDILIGGDGSDAFSGGTGDNLILTGSTAFAALSPDADLLFSTWNGRGSSGNRLKALLAEGGALFGTQVIRDSSVDRVDGRRTDSVLRSSDDELWGGRPNAELFV